MKRIAIVFWGFIIIIGIPVPRPVMHVSFGIVYAEEDWKTEFNDICAKTNDVMTLPPVNLQALVARCDALKTRIEKLDESTRKVYGKRLQGCRALFSFVLKSSEGK